MSQTVKVCPKCRSEEIRIEEGDRTSETGEFEIAMEGLVSVESTPGGHLPPPIKQPKPSDPSPDGHVVDGRGGAAPGASRASPHRARSLRAARRRG